MRSIVSIEIPDIGGELRSLLDNYRAQALDEMRKAFYEEANDIRTRSMEIVPFDDGILRDSAMAVGTNFENESLEGFDVVIGYGGAAASYAVVQHETPPGVFRHLPGRTWKYLERPSFEAAVGMGERLATRLRRLTPGA